MKKKKQISHNPSLPALKLNDQNTYRFLFLVLDRKQRESIYCSYQSVDKYYGINQVINEVFRHGYRQFSQLRTIATIKKLNVVKFVSVINGRDNEGYNSSFVYFQIDNEHLKHFVKDSCNTKSHQLLSQSLMSTLNNKMNNRHEGLLNVIYDQSKKLYSKQSDRNFHLRKDGTLSMLPKGKDSIVNSENKWSIEGRTTIKLGRGLRRMFDTAGIDKPLNDTELEKLVTAIQSDYIFTGSISMVTGSDIVKWYHGDNYAHNQATLTQSCMRHDTSQNHIEFYAKNKDVSMIIATDDDNKLLGRAIVWHNASLHTDDDVSIQQPFCDRIYGKPLTILAIQKYAIEQGFIVKQSQDYHSERYFAQPNGSTICADVSIRVVRHYTYPYMDTMKSIEFIDDTHGILHNNCDHKDLTGTDGNHDNDNGDEDMVHTMHGDYMHIDDTVWSDYHDEYIEHDLACYSDILNTYISESSAITLHNGDVTHCDEYQYVTLPDRTEARESDNLVVSGYVNGNFCSISKYFDTTFDSVVDTLVYASHMETVTITIVKDEQIHEFTIDTVVSESELASRDFDTLSSLCTHVIRDANENN